ncbi:BatA domain-containing protein [Luteolibacter sp. SL250]|uniref:BatA domain-containing protein n=1 Tax=Luteolibacter sp. SL250 TaxID=2995170 RepID=UPI002270A903|nr:BatA domain-containing protein [Luteolibacter sp. SL250]WAC18722.1 BatA domain-containing protein [Luteolibacter sp. SL250]
MAFLAPWFLVGLAALALPVLLHLRKNRPKKKVVFSSLMFLEATPPVTRRSSKLQDILLLLLRCLGLALLVIAFSRPFFRQNEKAAMAGGDGVMNFLLIDASASMRGQPLEGALAQAGKLIDGLPGDDWIAVAAYAEKLQPLLAPAASKDVVRGDRKSHARAMVGDIKPGWNAAKPEAVWTAAAAMAGEVADGVPVRIHVFSDFKKGGAHEGLRGGDWPEGVSFVLHRVDQPEGWTNAGVQALAGGDHPRARISNAEGSAKSDFILDWGHGSAPQPISVPPGESAVMDAPEGVKGGGTVKLSGDGPSFDNDSAWAPLIRPTARIRYIGADAATDATGSLFFLSRAMQPTAAYEVEIAESAAPDLTVASVPLDDAQVASIRAVLEAGGNVLLTLADAAGSSSLGRLIDGSVSGADEAAVGNFALLGEIDFGSSVFAPFADPRYSDFSGIRFWKHRMLPEAWIAKGAVLARFDSGEPAWLRYEVGKGALHVLTTTWRPADSQLALSTKFPPLLHALLSQSPALAVRAARYTVGQPVPLPEGVAEVALPDGTKVPVEAGKAFIPTAPGLHVAGKETFAVQIDPAETELTPMSDADLKSLGLPFDAAAASAGTSTAGTDVSDAERESRQRVGWWLLIAAAAAFLIETLLAARRSSGRTPTPDPIPT